MSNTIMWSLCGFWSHSIIVVWSSQRLSICSGLFFEYIPKAVRNSSEEANISLYTVMNLYCVSFILLRENLKCPLVSWVLCGPTHAYRGASPFQARCSRATNATRLPSSVDWALHSISHGPWSQFVTGIGRWSIAKQVWYMDKERRSRKINWWTSAT